MGVNRTLDDADSSIIYNGIWTTTGCAACLANPSPSQRERLEGGTYHEGVVGPNEGTKGAIFLFSGTSVYLYGWRAPATAGQPSIRDSDMSFFLDYVHVGDFKQPGGDRDEFDVLLFSQTRLAPGPHTLSVTVQPNSVALLDYLIFEEQTPAEEADAAAEGFLGGPLPSGTDRASDPFSPKSVGDTYSGTQLPTASSTPVSQPPVGDSDDGGVNVGLIAGILIGVFALLCGFFVWFIWRRRKRPSGELPTATRSQFYIDDDREVLEIKGAPLSRFNTASPAPRTPTFHRVFHDPGTAAHFDIPPSRENTPSPAQFAVQFHNSPPAAVRSPLAQHEFTPSEYPLPLGPPSEMTYPDTIDVPAAFVTLPVPPPPIPPEPRVPSPVAGVGASRRAPSRPASQAAHSVRRLVVYNAPSDISVSDVGHDSAPVAPPASRSSSRAAERRRRSPPPPLPIAARR